MRITISGPPGSGKTTACSKLSEVLGLEAVVFGKIFRELAAEKNLTLGELGAIAEKDPAIDQMIDSRILEIARAHPDIILESRLSAYMLTRNGIPAYRILLEASPDVRMARVGLREGETLEQATANTLERQKSISKAKANIKANYGIDIDDRSVYDLILNTDNLTPDEVLEKILEGVRGWHAD